MTKVCDCPGECLWEPGVIKCQFPPSPFHVIHDHLKRRVWIQLLYKQARQEYTAQVFRYMGIWYA